ncbi:alpha/beta fold hydrolase [Nocardia stercoris]|uniref:Alpha/beta hydrolase n=1 Tax=Nocardia stercoris TaxID=2483361 RepID=A0A3M2KWL4_9NOCA|nr:alpha/beta hydrolase [Nocardia stercoris]RMI29889.1 alpha/beta hydrolase [Nocardia stercoris]
MYLRTSALVLLAAVCTIAAGPAAADPILPTGNGLPDPVAPPGTVTVADGVVPPAQAAPVLLPGTIDLPCAGSTLRQHATWYLPEGRPRGLVWVQHGFARADGNVAELAESLSAAGYLVFAPSLPFLNLDGCTLQNLGDNTAFLDGVAELFATADDPAGPLAADLAAAAAAAGRIAPPLPRQFVFVGHSAGAEAVEYVAHHLHTDSPTGWTGLRGLILLDPVKSFLGNNTDVALTDLDSTALPIHAVAGPPGLCNNFGSGTTALQTLLHRDIVGVRLPAGEHTDAEGASSDLVGELACGAPTPMNTVAVRSLTTEWAGDYFAGTASAPNDAAAAAGAQVLTGAK